MRAGESTRRDTDPGVPEALPRTLLRLRERIGVDRIDRLWIFPPVRTGRRERGLVAVSTFQIDDERRSMITVAYDAEHTGRGVTVEPTYTIEGEAPPDRFPGVMQGVVRRAGEASGSPEEVVIDGSAEEFETLMERYEGDFLEGRES